MMSAIVKHGSKNVCPMTKWKESVFGGELMLKMDTYSMATYSMATYFFERC